MLSYHHSIRLDSESPVRSRTPNHFLEAIVYIPADGFPSPAIPPNALASKKIGGMAASANTSMPRMGIYYRVSSSYKAVASAKAG
mmetsp:Transcript_47711/g.48135  ORF Transcript_47711/g.48135 Transcript_47711/m.48135 type:complete len:85 (+) Transcript_47711:263-517(+)